MAIFRKNITKLGDDPTYIRPIYPLNPTLFNKDLHDKNIIFSKTTGDMAQIVEPDPNIKGTINRKDDVSEFLDDHVFDLMHLHNVFPTPRKQDGSFDGKTATLQKRAEVRSVYDMYPYRKDWLISRYNDYLYPGSIGYPVNKTPTIPLQYFKKPQIIK